MKRLRFRKSWLPGQAASRRSPEGIKRMRLGERADRGCPGDTTLQGVFSICTPSFPAFPFLLSLLNVGSQGTDGNHILFFFFLRQEPGLGWGVGGWAARMTVGLALPWLSEIEKPEWEITM